jgi:hypothetical protein
MADTMDHGANEIVLQENVLAAILKSTSPAVVNWKDNATTDAARLAGSQWEFLTSKCCITDVSMLSRDSASYRLIMLRYCPCTQLLQVLMAVVWGAW